MPFAISLIFAVQNEQKPLGRDAPVSRHHALKLQAIIASAAIPCAVIGGLIDASQWIDAAVKEHTTNACMLAVMVLIANFVSWSALWGMLGTGRWWVRFACSWLIFHLAVVVALATVRLAAWAQLSNAISGRVMLAYLAGFSYALSGQIIVFSLLVWLLRVMGWRMVYIHDLGAYPSRRERTALVAADRRGGDSLVQRGAVLRGGGVLKSRLSLIDLFVLTTLCAVYSAAWKPIGLLLAEDVLFGPGFLFVVIIAFLSCFAVVTLVVFLIVFVSMQERWGARVRHLVQGKIALAAIATALIGWDYCSEPAQRSAVIIGLLMLFAFQLLQNWLHRRPNRLFRFRLMISKANSLLEG